jgi:hypothetical protein
MYFCRMSWVRSCDSVDGVRPVPGSDALTERFTVIPARIFSPAVMSNVRFLQSLIKAGPEESGSGHWTDPLMAATSRASPPHADACRAVPAILSRNRGARPEATGRQSG